MPKVTSVNWVGQQCKKIGKQEKPKSMQPRGPTEAATQASGAKSKEGERQSGQRKRLHLRRHNVRTPWVASLAIPTIMPFLAPSYTRCKTLCTRWS